jgi:myo-inositol-1(or 4)-monophosphatase
VYHARIGGELRFENRALRVRRPSEEVSCRLIGDPGTLECDVFDARSTGSAAVECALVAAGIMSSAVFRRPRVWDVAGGIVLLRAGRKSVRVRAGGAWSEFASFVDAESRGAGIDAISEWRRELVLGAPAIVDRLGELGIG